MGITVPQRNIIKSTSLKLMQNIGNKNKILLIKTAKQTDNPHKLVLKVVKKDNQVLKVADSNSIFSFKSKNTSKVNRFLNFKYPLNVKNVNIVSLSKFVQPKIEKSCVAAPQSKKRPLLEPAISSNASKRVNLNFNNRVEFVPYSTVSSSHKTKQNDLCLTQSNGIPVFGNDTLSEEVEDSSYLKATIQLDDTFLKQNVKDIINSVFEKTFDGGIDELNAVVDSLLKYLENGALRNNRIKEEACDMENLLGVEKKLLLTSGDIDNEVAEENYYLAEPDIFVGSFEDAVEVPFSDSTVITPSLDIQNCIEEETTCNSVPHSVFEKTKTDQKNVVEHKDQIIEPSNTSPKRFNLKSTFAVVKTSSDVISKPSPTKVLSLKHTLNAAEKSDELEKRKFKAMRERRIVYMGNIPSWYSHNKLEERFSRFGEIENIEFKTKECDLLDGCSNGDALSVSNFGPSKKDKKIFAFITYRRHADATKAIERGNDCSGPVLTLNFGGRRHFVKEDYTDLDGNAAKSNFSYKSSSNLNQQGETDDYALLLKREQRKRGLLS